MPEQTLTNFLKAWEAKNINRMLQFTQWSWILSNPEKKVNKKEAIIYQYEQKGFVVDDYFIKKNGINKIKGTYTIGHRQYLKNLINSMELERFEIIDNQPVEGLDNEIITDYKISLQLILKTKNPKHPKGKPSIQEMTRMALSRLIKENEKGEPDKDGAWGVNPPSIYREAK